MSAVRSLMPITFFFSVTPLRETHPPQHTQDVQALPPKIPNLVVPRRPVLSIIITITLTITHLHTALIQMMLLAITVLEICGRGSCGQLMGRMFLFVLGVDPSSSNNLQFPNDPQFTLLD